jgi:transposase-like protein|tara:strand:- start:222 stop:419 length:198 start_codon:yes stop_codon:yes gene_type:complete
MQKLSDTDLSLFRGLSSMLSPENLSADGEIPQSAVKKRARFLLSEWKKLERKVGRVVTEDEVWEF